MAEDTKATPQAPTPDIDVARLRELALDAPAKQMDLDTPFWPGTNGQFALADIPSDEIMELDKIRKNSDTQSPYLAAIICRALIKRSTGQPVFSERDRDVVAKMGTSVLTPIFKQITEFYGLGADVKAAIEDAKKNL